MTIALTELASSPIAVGLGPAGVAAGNFNGGFPDLVVVNNGAGADSVSVILATGPGTYAPAVNYPAGTLPFKVVVDDFNNDGSLDVGVTTNNPGPGFAIALGTGTGTLNPINFISFPGGSYAIATADFDGDLNKDLAIGHATGVGIFMGDGTGIGFTPQGIVSTPAFPADIKTGDVNNDGAQDLIVAAGSDVLISLGVGDGTFLPANSFAVTSTVNNVATGDFNADSFLDVVVAEAGAGGQLSVLLGTGTGGLGPVTSYSLPNANSVVAFDVDGSGRLSLVGADSVTADYAVFPGFGDGTFDLPIIVSGTNANGVQSSLIAADLTGDSKIDLASTNPGFNTVTIMENQSTPPPSVSGSPSTSASETNSPTPTTSTTASTSNSATASSSASLSRSVTGSATSSASGSASSTPSPTPSSTMSTTISLTNTITLTGSVSPTPSSTGTTSSSTTISPTVTPTEIPSPSLSGTPTSSTSLTSSTSPQSNTPTQSRTPTLTSTSSRSPSFFSSSVSSSITKTRKPTSSRKTKTPKPSKTRKRVVVPEIKFNTDKKHKVSTLKSTDCNAELGNAVAEIPPSKHFPLGGQGVAARGLDNGRGGVFIIPRQSEFENLEAENLTPEQGVVVFGKKKERLGTALLFHDFYGDGEPALIVSAKGTKGREVVYIIRGPIRNSVNIEDLTSDQLLTIKGPKKNSGFGFDLAVLVSNIDSSDSLLAISSPGLQQVHLIKCGRHYPSPLKISDLDPQDGFTIVGEGSGEFGYSICSGGLFFKGEDFPPLVIGNPDTNVVHVVRLPQNNTQSFYDIAELPQSQFYSKKHEQLGHDVALVPSSITEDDGLLLGAPGANNKKGIAYYVQGGHYSWFQNISLTDAFKGTRIHGSEQCGKNGFAVAFTQSKKRDALLTTAPFVNNGAGEVCLVYLDHLLGLSSCDDPELPLSEAETSPIPEVELDNLPAELGVCSEAVEEGQLYGHSITGQAPINENDKTLNFVAGGPETCGNPDILCDKSSATRVRPFYNSDFGMTFACAVVLGIITYNFFHWILNFSLPKPKVHCSGETATRLQQLKNDCNARIDDKSIPTELSLKFENLLEAIEENEVDPARLEKWQMKFDKLNPFAAKKPYPSFIETNNNRPMASPQFLPESEYKLG